MRWITRNRFVLPCVILLGGALRFYGIDDVWFGFDERVTLNLGQADWFTFQRVMLAREMNMVGYYGLVRLWLSLGFDLSRDVLIFVRWLSAIFSIATIPVLYGLGKKLFNENVGLLAAGLLAINQFHIKHAQNARSYSMFVFLVTVATLLFVNNLKTPNPKWVMYICVWVSAVYIHMFAFVFLAAHLVIMAYIGLRPKILQLACLFAGVSPMAFWTVTHRSVPTLNWVQPTTPKSVAELFAIFVGNDGFFLLFIVIAVTFVACLSGLRETGGTILLLWVFVPVVLAVLASYAQPCFVPRFLIPCLPATTLLTAASIERFKTLPAAVVLVLIVFGMMMGTQPIGA